MAEADIRQRIEGGAKALRAKDIDAVMSLYAPNIVSFDLDPPCDTPGRKKNVELGKHSSLYTLPPSPTRYAS